MAKRRRHLVKQHLENVSRRVLEQYQDMVRDYVKGRRGIYALYRRNRLYYVGLASNLRGRLRTHLKDRHGQSWDSFSLYLTESDAQLRELEALVLRITMPKGNVSKTKLPKSEDLRRTLRRRIVDKQRLEVDRLFGKAVRRRRRKSKGQKALKDVVRQPLAIRMDYKGKTYSARVRSDGTVRYAGKVYTSLSGAAKAVAKRPMHGWYWWKFRNPRGKWVRMKELRR